MAEQAYSEQEDIGTTPKRVCTGSFRLQLVQPTNNDFVCVRARAVQKVKV